jgi:hypothetical protein
MLIDSLPEDELEIFCLYYSPNMSYKKVADKKGISGDWSDADIEDEEVIDRQYEGVEYCEDE